MSDNIATEEEKAILGIATREEVKMATHFDSCPDLSVPYADSTQNQTSRVLNDQKFSSVNANNQGDDAGLAYMITDILSWFKISGILSAAVIIPSLWFWIFGSTGLAFNVLVILGLSLVWQRHMEKYKAAVRTEIHRQAGFQKMIEDGEESAEWLNHIVSRFWIIFEPVLSEIIVSSVNPMLDYYRPSFLDSIGFSKFTLGTNAPRIISFKAYPQTNEDTIRFDVDAVFQPKDPEDLSLRKDERNSEIILAARLGKAVGVDIPVLVKEMAFSGRINIQLTTMSQFPYVKLATVQFPTYPKIEFVLKPLKGMDLMDLPGLKNFLQHIINEVLGWLFVAPAAFTLDLDELMNGAAVSTESSIGVLMLRMYEGRGLKNVETLRQSDPYALIAIGGREVARTKVIDNNLNPYWNETFYILVQSLNDTFEIQVFDEDLIKDRPLGNFKSKLSDFGLDVNNAMDDVWKPLSLLRGGDREKLKGEVRFEMKFYPIAEKTDHIISKSGIMRISVHQAKELDESKSMVGLYNPFVDVFHNELLVHKTKIKKRTNNPQWDSIFQVFIRDTEHDKLKFVVRDQRDLSHDPELGDCEILVTYICHMLKNPSSKVDWWSLRNAESGKLRVTFHWTPIEFDHPVPPLSTSGKISLPPAIGALRVKIVEARGLKNFEAVGLSDPYVNVVYAGDIRAKTSVIHNSLDPLWNSSFYILVQDSSLKGNITFDIYDFNNMAKDRFMGTASYDLKQLLEISSDGLKLGDARDMWLPLTVEGKNGGKIRVELGYHEIKKRIAAPIMTETEVMRPDGSVETKIVPQIVSPVDKYNCGIVRIDIHEVLLESAPLALDGYNEKKKPSPYVEILDISLSITSNDVENLKERARGKGTPGPNLGRRTTQEQLVVGIAEAVQNNEEKVSADDIVTLYHTSAQKKVYDPKYNETAELFVKDIENAKILVLVKDKEGKSMKGDDSLKFDKENFRNRIIGKIDLSVKTLIHSAFERTESVIAASAEENPQTLTPPTEWFKIFSTNAKVGSSIGKIRLSVSFAPVDLDENWIAAEQDLEATDTGRLQMELVEARNLPAVDSSGTSDPYCNFKVNGEKIFKSKVIKKNNIHPKWNESFEIPLSSRMMARLVVECRDWNQFEENKLLGTVHFDCSKLVIEEDIDDIYELFDEDGKNIIGPNGEKSTVHLKYHFVPDETLSAKKRRRLRSKGRVLKSGIGAANSAFHRIHAAGGAAKKFLKLRKSVDGVLDDNSSFPVAVVGSFKEMKQDHDNNSSNIITAPPIHSDQTLSNSSNDYLKPQQLPEQRGTVLIHILKGEHLNQVDANGLADPYVKVRLLSGAVLDNKSVSSFLHKKEGVLYETKVIKKNLNPVWNESFMLPVEYVPDQELVLSFSIKDHNVIGVRTRMGEFDLNLKDAFIGQDLHNNFEIDICTKKGELRGGGDGILYLHIEYQANGTLVNFKNKKAGFSTSSMNSLSDAESLTGQKERGIFGGLNKSKK